MVDIVVGFVPPQFKLSSPSEARAGDVAPPARRTDARRSDSDRDVARGLFRQQRFGPSPPFPPLAQTWPLLRLQLGAFFGLDLARRSEPVSQPGGRTFVKRHVASEYHPIEIAGRLPGDQPLGDIF